MNIIDHPNGHGTGCLRSQHTKSTALGRAASLTEGLTSKEVELLRKFQKLTPFYSSITERTRSTNFSEAHNSATWTLCSLEARSLLNRLGLPYGRKSQTITPPRGDFSRRDYLRGVVDADGSVGYTSQGFPFISLTTASTAVGTCLSFYAQELTDTKRSLKRNTRDGIYNILYMKEPAQALAADLYYPGCLSLQRKQTAADSLSAWARPAGMKIMTHRRWDEHQDRILLTHTSPTAAAAALGRTVQSCSLRLWRLRTGQVPMPDNQ